jgi:hypothetical protein
MMDLRNESHQHFNDRIVSAMDADGDAAAAAATTTENTLENPFENPLILGVQQSDNCVISNDATINHDDTHKQGGEDKEVGHTNDSIYPPISCWIPFSYIIVGKCRRHAREGLPMPLADASSIPLI